MVFRVLRNALNTFNELEAIQFPTVVEYGVDQKHMYPKGSRDTNTNEVARTRFHNMCGIGRDEKACA